MVLRSSVLICPYFRIISSVEKERFSKCYKYQFFCIKNPKNVFLRYLCQDRNYFERADFLRQDMIPYCKANCPKIDHFPFLDDDFDFFQM